MPVAVVLGVAVAFKIFFGVGPIEGNQRHVLLEANPCVAQVAKRAKSIEDDCSARWILHASHEAIELCINAGYGHEYHKEMCD